MLGASTGNETVDLLGPMLESVDRFCLRRLSPDEVRRRDDAHQPPYDLLPELGELGVLRVPFAEEVGGLGMGWASLSRLQERIAYHAYFAASIVNRVVGFGVSPILQFGSGQQKNDLIPKLLDGKLLIALALTEPDAGSDARAVTLRAVRDGTNWRLNGRKTWISDAGGAGYLLTLCRTPGERGGETSLTAFLVPTSSGGLSMTELPKVGNNCMPSWDIGYDDVVIDDACRIGEPGQGFEVVTGSLRYSRASMASTTVGCAQAALDLAVDYAKNRKQFGRAIGSFQVIKHRLADMNMEVTKARLVVRELVRRVDANEPCDDIAAMAKVTSTEALQFVANHGMQILASAGYSAESAMQRYWRDARLYTFGEGTNEIQREIIARQMGL